MVALDVEFKDDELLRYRAGHGTENMAVIRRFALNLVRANKAKGKMRRKRAGAPNSCWKSSRSNHVNPDSVP
jgi:hypothetical protein